MAYEKQTWQSGDIITAEKLNHIEDGIGGGQEGIFIAAFRPVIVGQGVFDHYESDKTFDEILAAIVARKNVVAVMIPAVVGQGKEISYNLATDRTSWYNLNEVEINNSPAVSYISFRSYDTSNLSVVTFDSSNNVRVTTKTIS